MKSFAIYCVTYNSYDELHKFLVSVSIAARKAADMAVTVYVSDNTEEKVQNIKCTYPNITVIAFKTSYNCGYLGAIQQCMEVYCPEKFDYFAISNVDVQLDIDSLRNLGGKILPENTGWIAPQISSKLEQRDRNPAIMSRYSRRKLSALMFLYTHPWLNMLYERTLYKRKKIKVRNHVEGEEIYAGHGSFMIFTKRFFQKTGIPQYPIFLFGEEIYLAEMCRKAGLKTVYVPSIKILDSEHCSVSKMHSSTYYKYNAESIKYLLEKFYK